MSVKMTEEQQLLVEAAKEFAQTEIRASVAKMESTNEMDFDCYQKMCDMGFKDMSVPEEYGGLGVSMVTKTAVEEEFAKESLALAICGTGNPVATTVISAGTDEQKERFLPGLVGGTNLAGFAFTEPVAGSDASGIQSTAVRDGDDWILKGQKTFISYRCLCNAFLVSARTPDGKGPSAFLVPKDTPGLTVGPAFVKMGMHGADTGEIFLDDVRVPAINMIGTEGHGMRAVFHTLDLARMGSAVAALGLAEGAMAKALDYVRERTTFGQPVISNQGIQWYLADMRIDIEATRGLVYEAAEALDEGRPFTTAAAMAKLQATRTANKVAWRSSQLCGGLGLMNDFGMERYIRDAKTCSIIEGTDEILKIVIARDIVKG